MLKNKSKVIPYTSMDKLHSMGESLCGVFECDQLEGKRSYVGKKEP